MSQLSVLVFKSEHQFVAGSAGKIERKDEQSKLQTFYSVTPRTGPKPIAQSAFRPH
jgi:hypothetical protein